MEELRKYWRGGGNGTEKQVCGKVVHVCTDMYMYRVSYTLMEGTWWEKAHER